MPVLDRGLAAEGGKSRTGLGKGNVAGGHSPRSHHIGLVGLLSDGALYWTIAVGLVVGAVFLLACFLIPDGSVDVSSVRGLAGVERQVARGVGRSVR